MKLDKFIGRDNIPEGVDTQEYMGLPNLYLDDNHLLHLDSKANIIRRKFTHTFSVHLQRGHDLSNALKLLRHAFRKSKLVEKLDEFRVDWYKLEDKYVKEWNLDENNDFFHMEPSYTGIIATNLTGHGVMLSSRGFCQMRRILC